MLEQRTWVESERKANAGPVLALRKTTPCTPKSLAVLALIGPVAIATVRINASADKGSVAHNAAAAGAACKYPGPILSMDRR
jgi:hypothetical protein